MAVGVNFNFLKDSKNYLSILQGGSRSGKTYAVLQYLVALCVRYQNAGLRISLVRATTPAVKSTVLVDLIEILQSENLFDENNWNKTEKSIDVLGNTFFYFGVDSEQKVRGRRQNICFANELNELTWEKYVQLELRTSHKFIGDWNPSDPDSWIVTKLEKFKAEICDKQISTYKDNPFLTDHQIRNIENLQKTDPEFWNVFGLGQLGQGRRGLIYPNVKESEEEFEPQFFGVDFGFSNDPSAVVAGRIKDGVLYLKEIFYQVGFITSDLAKEIKSVCGSKPVFCDNARPDSIEELRRFGLNAQKGPKFRPKAAGIDRMKAFEIRVDPGSKNLNFELKTYAWIIDNNGKPTNEPRPINDHLLDAAIYGALGFLDAYGSGSQTRKIKMF
jgi:phage terminase large subunit